MSFAAGIGPKASSAEYYLARTGRIGDKRAWFSVTKFLGADEPASRWTVEVGPKYVRCDCPAWRRNMKRPCKHCEMVAVWVAAGEPEGAFNLDRCSKILAKRGISVLTAAGGHVTLRTDSPIIGAAPSAGEYGQSPANRMATQRSRK